MSVKQSRNNRAQRRKEETRQRLLKSTEELLYSGGYKALTVLKITENADLGYGTFYLHFDNLDDAVWLVAQQRLNTFVQGLIADVAQEVPRYRAYIGWVNIFRFTLQERTLFLEMYGRSGSTQLTQAYLDWIVETFELGMTANHFQPHARPAIYFQAQFMAGAVMRTLCWWAENGFEQAPEEMGRLLYEMTYQEALPEDPV